MNFPQVLQFGLLAILPLGMLGYVGYMNFLPFGSYSQHLIDVGAKQETVLSPNRVSFRRSIEDTTFRELGSDRVYFSQSTLAAEYAKEITVQVRFRFPDDQPISLAVGARNRSSQYSFQNIFDPFFEALHELPLVIATNREKIFSTQPIHDDSVSKIGDFITSLSPGAIIASDNVDKTKNLIPATPKFESVDRLEVMIPEYSPPVVTPIDSEVASEIAKLTNFVSGPYQVFSQDRKDTGKLTWPEFLKALAPGSTIATDNVPVVQQILSPPFDLPTGMTILGNEVFCETKSSPHLRVDTVLRGPHTLWTWVKGDKLRLTVGKVDLNGYKNSDDVTVTIYDGEGISIGSVIIPDDGVIAATREPGNMATKTVDITVREGLHRIVIDGNSDWLIEFLELNQGHLVIENTLQLASRGSKPANPRSMTFYTVSFDNQDLFAHTLYAETTQTIDVISSDKYPLVINAPQKWFSYSLIPGLYEITAHLGVVSYKTNGFFSFTPCSWFHPDQIDVIPVPHTIKALNEKVDYIVVTNSDAHFGSTIQSDKFAFKTVPCPDESGGLIIDTSLRGPHTFWTWVNGTDLDISMTKLDINGYNGPDSVVLEVYNSIGKLLRSVEVPDDGITDASHKQGSPQRQRLFLEELSTGPYRIVVNGNSDFLILRLDVNQEKLVIENNVYLAGGTYTGDPVQTMAIYSSSVRQRQLGAKTLHTRQHLTIVSTDYQKQLKISGLDKWFHTPVIGFHALVTEMGDLIISDESGVFSLTPCSWFLPRAFDVVLITRDIAELKKNVDYIVLTESDYIPVEVEADAAGKWFVGTTRWSGEEIYSSDNGLLQFAFRTPGNILVDWIKIYVDIPPIWERRDKEWKVD